jgi:predicted transposase/invertase (TIGR01784 family)
VTRREDGRAINERYASPARWNAARHRACAEGEVRPLCRAESDASWIQKRTRVGTSPDRSAIVGSWPTPLAFQAVEKRHPEYALGMRNAHDLLFRHVFSQPEHAEGELKQILPAKIVRAVDWSTLRLVSGTVVDPELAEQRSDVLFSVTLAGREVFVYLLLEHQSTSEALMALRVLGYMLRIWEDWAREHAKTEGLPPIIALVVHHSESGWSKPISFGELFELDEELRALLEPFLPRFEFLLDDLSLGRDEELRSRAMTALGRLVLFCLKRARRSKDMSVDLESWQDAIGEVLEAPNGVAAFATVLRYILAVTDTPPEHLRNMSKRLGRRAEEAYMTGEQILIEQGRKEGEAKGQAKALLKQLELKFGPVTEDVALRVRAGSVKELDRWIERVITATSIDEMFGD